MSDFDGNNGERTSQREPPDPTMFANMPSGGYEPHPLFPRDDDGPEDRDICYVTFRRKRTDGRIDNCPEDIPSGEIQSWADVTGPWGGGEYKAIGKDRRHRIVAWYPPKNGEWLLFDQESRPFTLRNGHRYSPAVAPPAAPAAPPPSPPPSPPAPSPTEALMMEILRELRAQRQSPPPAPPAPTSAASSEAVLIAMIHAQGEMARAALTAALSQRPAEGSNTAVELLKVMREWAPQAQPQAQASMSERLGEYKQIRELTTPAAVMPPPSEFGEIKELLMSVMQADALNKTTAPPPPPPAVERRPPPRRPPCYLPGIGMVDEADVSAILSDPAARACVVNALAVGAGPSAGATVPPPAYGPMAAPGQVHAASAAPVTPVPIARTPAPPVVSTPVSAPAPAPVPSAPAPTAEVARPQPPPAPTREMSLDALLADPALRERVIEALAATNVGAASRVAEVPSQTDVSAVSPPMATPAVSSAPAPNVPPAVPSAAKPAPTESSTKPSAPAASDDRRASVAAPVQVAERRTKVVTDEDRMRAVPALRTIARLPMEQQRAELSKLPGMDREAIDSFVSVFLPATDSFSTDTWAAFVAALPPDAVRTLVDGPGG